MYKISKNNNKHIYFTRKYETMCNSSTIYYTNLTYNSFIRGNSRFAFSEGEEEEETPKL